MISVQFKRFIFLKLEQVFKKQQPPSNSICNINKFSHRNITVCVLTLGYKEASWSLYLHFAINTRITIVNTFVFINK